MAPTASLRCERSSITSFDLGATPLKLARQSLAISDPPLENRSTSPAMLPLTIVPCPLRSPSSLTPPQTR
eukprot:2797459-Rhodomonas_salina.1